MQEEIHVAEQLVHLALVDVGRGGRKLGTELRDELLGDPSGERSVPRRIDPLLAPPELAEDLREHLVEQRSARSRVEPRIGVGHALLHRLEAQAAVEQVAERTARDLLEPGGRQRAARVAGIESAPRRRDEPVPRREAVRFAFRFGFPPAAEGGEGRLDGGHAGAAGPVEGGEPPPAVVQRSVGPGRHGGDRVAESRAQVVVRGVGPSRAEAVGLEDEPRRERLASLAHLEAGERQADVPAQSRQARDGGLQRLAQPIARRRQLGHVAKLLALVVEQHGVLERGREHAALLETDDERVRAPRVSRLRQRRHVERPRARAGRPDPDPRRPLAQKAHRVAQRQRERIQDGELAECLVQSFHCRRVEIAQDRGMPDDETPSAGEHVAEPGSIPAVGNECEE